LKTFLILLIFYTPLSVSVYGQNQDQEPRESKTDVVYLKNGSMIRGEIMEIKEDTLIRIRYADSRELIIDFSEIERVSSDQKRSRQNYNSSGYMNRSGLELLSGTGNSTFRFATIHGKHFNSHLSAGLGIGITPYNDPLNLIPFFANFNYRLLKANTSPFIFLKAGYNFSVYNEDDENVQLDQHTGGLLLNPGAGIEFNVSPGFGWYVQAGYNIDQSSYEFESWWSQQVRTDLSYRRISIGMGLTF
jgi:hypothetical protein